MKLFDNVNIINKTSASGSIKNNAYLQINVNFFVGFGLTYNRLFLLF